MPHRAVAIANEFLAQPGANEFLTQMALQKLTYFAHGWNWAVNRDRLVIEAPEAWAFGPVYRDLYDHTKTFGKQPIGRLITTADSEAARIFGLRGNEPSPYVAPLTERERAVIQHVWRRYRGLDAIALSQLTHRPGTPWFETYQNRGQNTPIDDQLIRQHYERLAADVPAA